MTEHDLSTLLRDELSGEPPLQHTGADAIRTARRQSTRRGLLAAGAGTLAVAAVVTVGLGVRSVVADDAPPPVSVASEPAPPLTDVMESTATAGLTPYVGALGEPGWRIKDGLGEDVPADDPTAQYFMLSYEPASPTLRVNLSVGGFAPADIETYSFADSCRQQLAEGIAESCDITTLDDGSLLMTTVALRSAIDTDSQRMLSRADQLEGNVAWMRGVSLSTPDGMAVDAAEYLPADVDLTAPDWQVPLRELRALVLDPTLRGADVAHEPMPAITGE